MKVENISKSYDGLPVIKNFSMEVIRGDKIGIIGNNGRGKTALLKMLAFALEPDQGKIEKGHQALLGYFPQNHAEIVEKTGSKTAFD